MKPLVWIKQGPAVTDSLVAIAEQSIGFSLPEDFVWFLKNVTNGGHPTPPPEFPILGLEGDDRMVLHGMYGISTARNYNLQFGLSIAGVSRLGPRLFPIGFDPLGGQLYIVCAGENIGQILYLPLEEIWDLDTLPDGYFVANNIRKFASVLHMEIT